MPDTRAVFFWMGGVISLSIEPLLRKALAEWDAEVNLFAKPGFAGACEDLAIGRQDDLAFCQAVCAIAGVEIAPVTLREAVVAAFEPKPRVVQTIQQLPRAVQRWLIVDYPRAWFERGADLFGIYPCFPEDHLIFLTESRLGRLVPDVFDFLAHRAQLRLDQCLVVDEESHRAVAALDYGFPSAIFVDARRLEREFVMRQFTAKVPLEHRPATVPQPSAYHP